MSLPPRLHSMLMVLHENRDQGILDSLLNHSDYSDFMALHGLTLARRDLVTAFIHTSFAHEYEVGDQEQSEFLGDSVLQLILTEELCRRYPAEQEGKLSKMRSTLVNEKTLSKLARRLGLEALILAGKGEFKKNMTSLESVQADTFEAMLCQIYRHHGLQFTKNLVLKWYEAFLPEAFDLSVLESFDVKSRLQEKSLAHFKKLPRYSTETKGDLFEVKLWINDELAAAGVFSSRKNGEKALAQIVLDKGII
jgi:ribonuclease III